MSLKLFAESPMGRFERGYFTVLSINNVSKDGSILDVFDSFVVNFSKFSKLVKLSEVNVA